MAKGKIQGITIALDGDVTGLDKAIKSLNKPINNIQKEISSVNRALKFNPSSMELMNQKSLLLDKNVTELSTKFKTLKASKSDIDKAFKEGNINEEQYRAFNRELEITASRLEDAQKKQAIFAVEVERSDSKLKKAADHLNNYSDKAIKMGTTIDGIGNKLMPLSLGVGAALTGAGAAAISFESDFAGVIKTVDTTPEKLAEIRSGILGMTKVLPASAGEITRVAEAAGQLGIEADNVLSFSRTMIDIGEATNMSSNEAATALARLANITQMPQDQFNKLGSVVVALGNNLATTESEIVEMGLRIAGAGKQVGMSEADILSFAGALSSLGIEAQAGGSSISKVMVNMQLAVETGSEALKDFAHVAGMSADEFQKAFKDDAAGAISTFILGLQDTERLGKSAIAMIDEMGLSEIRLRDTLLRASNANELFSSSIEMGRNAWEENIALTKEAEQRYATTESQLKMLLNEVKLVAIELGDAMLPALKDIVSTARNAIQSFQGLDSNTKKIIIRIGLAVTAIAPLLKISGSLIKTTGNIAAGISKIEKLKTASKIKKITTELSLSRTTATKASKSYSAAGLNIKTLGSASKTAVPAVKAFGVSMNAALGVLGIAAVAIPLVISAVKALGNEFKSTYSISDRAKVSADAIKSANEEMAASAKESINAFTEARKSVESELVLLKVNSKQLTKETADSLVSKYANMGQRIKDEISSSNSEALKTFTQMYSADGVISARQEGILKAITENGANQTREVDRIQKEITAIFEKQVNENGRVTEEGYKELTRLTNEYQSLQLKALTAGESEQLAMAERLKSGNIRIAKESLEETTNAIVEANKTATAEIESNYTKRLALAFQQANGDEVIYRKMVADINKWRADSLVAVEENMTGQLTLLNNMVSEKEKIAKEDLSKQQARNKKANAEGSAAIREEHETTKNARKEIEKLLRDSNITIETIRANDTHNASMNAEKTVENVTSSLQKGTPVIKAAAEALSKAAIPEGKEQEANYAGSMIALGLAAGLTKEQSKVIAAAQSTVNAIMQTFTGVKGFDIHSPSKWAGKTILFVAQGAVKGFSKGTPLVTSAATSFGSAIKGSINKSVTKTAPIVLKTIDQLNSELKSREIALTKELEDIRSRAEKEASDKEFKEYNDKLWELTEKKKRAKKESQTSIQKEIDSLQDDWNRKQLDKERKQAEDEIKIEQDKVKDKLKLYEDYQRDISSYATSLENSRKLFETSNDSRSGEELFNLRDLKEDIFDLERFNEVLLELQDKSLPEGLLNEIKGMSFDDARRYAESLNLLSDEDMDGYIAKWTERANISRQIAENFYKKELEALDEAFLSQLPKEVDAVKPDMEKAGINIARGVADGFKSQESNITNSVRRVMQSAILAAKSELKINSPSKVFYGMGENTGKSYTIGLESQEKNIQKSMSILTPDVMTSELTYANKKIDNKQQKQSMDPVNGFINALSTLLTPNNSKNRQVIEIPVVIDGRELSRLTYDSFENERKRRE